VTAKPETRELARTPFLIGIDLGTTNCAVAFVDTRRRNPKAEVFLIPQLTSPGVVLPGLVLPSFLYFPEPDEIAAGGFALPWDPHPNAIVGILARDRGALAPARQVASAKSWLAHPRVDHHAAFLPWGATGSESRISPVEASTEYLIHIREAWNSAMAARGEGARFERQSIVLTVPASFDEEARELTVEAAQAAQFERLTLLEEPIAAFYAWLAAERRGIELEDDRIALVCDVGGGTTDFSLIRVRLEGEPGTGAPFGAPSFERVSIGEHLLLGGDNLDLALAAILERRIAELRPAMRLAVTQRAALRRLCSAAKERMLTTGEEPATGHLAGAGHVADDELREVPDRVPITLLGAGRSLVGDSVTTDLTADDVRGALREFLPVAPPVMPETPEVPVTPMMKPGRDHRAGLRELGLPYETDPAITHHLATFLTRSAVVFPADHRALVTMAGQSTVSTDERRMVRPDLVLFNGGFFSPYEARERIVQALALWFGERPRVLATANLEAAVAIGAATYARLREGIGRPGPLVKAGSGRAYYLALGAPDANGNVPAICVLARGAEEGTEHTFDQPFTIVTNRPVSFSLYSSTTRSDRAGDVMSLDLAGEVRAHAPLVTVFRYGRKSRHVELQVRLSVTSTLVGTLELWCRSEETGHRWRLKFEVRSAPEELDAAEEAPDREAEVVIADDAMVAAEARIRVLFAGSREDALSGTVVEHTNRSLGDTTSETIVAQMEQDFGFAKSAWPIGAIRRLADCLLQVADGRRRSAALEARWLNLFGFCIRPGFGASKDPWRIGEARKVYAAGLAFEKSIQNQVEWLVLSQRASGGFNQGQQRELAQRVMGELGFGGTKAKKLNPQIERESWRLLANLERIDAATRTKIGDEVTRRLRRDKHNATLLWSLGRLGARTPIYGPLTSVVPAPVAGRWLEELARYKQSSSELLEAIVQIGALTGDPLRDVEEGVLNAARQRVRDAGFDSDAKPLFEVVPETLTNMSRAFGEPLPNGLQLVIAR